MPKKITLDKGVEWAVDHGPTFAGMGILGYLVYKFMASRSEKKGLPGYVPGGSGAYAVEARPLGTTGEWAFWASFTTMNDAYAAKARLEASQKKTEFRVVQQ